MRPQSSTPYFVIVHYLGDGTTSQKIEFIPEEWPRYIRIFPTPETSGCNAMFEKICGMGWGAFSIRYLCGAPPLTFDEISIIGEGPGYFIVSDNDGDWHPNKLNAKYTAMVLI